MFKLNGQSCMRALELFSLNVLQQICHVSYNINIELIVPHLTLILLNFIANV